MTGNGVHYYVSSKVHNFWTKRIKDQQLHFNYIDVLYCILVTNMFRPKHVGDHNTQKKEYL